MRRVVVIASASGSGKTTLGRELAERLAVPFVEVDALVHGPDWTEASDAVLRERLQPVLAGDGWVLDSSYERKVGDLVLDAADTVVWLDLPVRVWLPRLARRTWQRIRDREELWHGNREGLRTALWGRDSLFMWAFRSHYRHRRDWPSRLARYQVVRLRSPEEVDAWLAKSG